MQDSPEHGPGDGRQDSNRHRRILNFCLHLALEEGANMEEEHVCPFCETSRLQRLLANMEQHVDNYT